jgi:hypothetical protein|tara:strand:+ start:34 stop:144 length:111 start_codon:yes stop_codon:yes gene_type:complete
MKKLLFIILIFLGGCSIEKEVCKKETKECCIKKSKK